MAKAQNKTTQTKASVASFIGRITDPQKKADVKILLKLMQEASGEKPAMWGSAIIGYGKYHYKYASGREGDAGLVGFSPRSTNITVYIVPGFKKYGALLNKLGKYKITGGSCLYIKRLSDIHLPTLKKLISTSARDMRKKYNVSKKPQRAADFWHS